MKKFKKLQKTMAFLLCICTLACNVFTAAYAQDDMGLTAAITRVKSVIDIPEEYQQFNYSSHTTQDGRTVWTLEWTGDNGFANAYVDSDGTIYEYYQNSYTNSDSQWSTITEAEGKAMADDFIKKVDEALSSKLILDRVDGYGSYTTYVYIETADGIKLNNRYVNVRVDRVNKTVSSYYSEGVSKKQIQSGDIIGKDAALKLYAEKIGAKIIYRKNYDYKNKTVKTYPVYVLNNTGNTAIGAISGEAVSYKNNESENWYVTGGGAMNDAIFGDMENSKAEGSVTLTPEELAAVEAVSGLISREQADELIKKEFPELGGIEISSASLIRDYYFADQYYWNIRYHRDGAADNEKYTYLNASAKLDAKTGELLNWSFSDADYSYETQVSEEDAKKTAHAFIDRFAKEKFALCGDIQVSKNGKDYISYTFTVPRLANGAEVEGESLSLTVTPDGRVTYYNNNITEGLNFDSIDGAIDVNAAVEKFSAYGGFELIYVYTGEKYEPVYEITNKYIEVNPLNGERVVMDGAYPEAPDGYSDLDGHWAKATVEELLDNGYFLEGNTFNPDAPITVKEFLSYAQFVYNGSDDRIKLLIAEVEPDTAALGDIDVNRTLTRELAAKYITQNMGCAGIAKHSEIFVYPFADADAVSEELIGHIAICYAEKIFNGDGNGNFNPSKEMIRAEAAAVIYNYYSGK